MLSSPKFTERIVSGNANSLSYISDRSNSHFGGCIGAVIVTFYRCVVPHLPTVIPFPEKRMIWSNIDLDLKDWISDLKEEYPDLSEDDYRAMMIERNGEHLVDERENLNLHVGDDILAVGDLGRWNGRRMGYKTIESGKISDCLSSDCDYAEWYVDREGEFRGKEIHHDGTNYIYYRKFKESADYDDRAELMDQIYRGVAKQEDIDRLTEKLGEQIGAVYGWEFPTKEYNQIKQR